MLLVHRWFLVVGLLALSTVSFAKDCSIPLKNGLRMGECYPDKGSAIVVNESLKMSLVNEQGQVMTADKYSYIYPVLEDYFIAGIEESGIGIIDNEGQIILPVEYDHLLTYSTDIICARQDDAWGCFDIKGKEKIASIYNNGTRACLQLDKP